MVSSGFDKQERKIEMSDYDSVTKRTILSVLALVVASAFTYVQLVGYLIPGFYEISLLRPKTTQITDVGLIWVPIIFYGLVGSVVCLTVNVFWRPKDMELEGGGLIAGLLGGFAVGLIVGSFAGLFAGIAGWLSSGSVMALIAVPIMIISVGLIAGLVFGIIFGLKYELK